MKFSNSRSNNKNRTFKRSNNHHRRQGDSSNGTPKVTGNLTTVLEKYKNLAKDATSAGDYISAENYLQHAEHFIRVLNERNAKNNVDSKPTKTNSNGTTDINEPENDQPVDIVKVLKPIPLDSTEEDDATNNSIPVKKKTIKKSATVKE